jgi:uncharacterized LabA/DUF88 family protein
MSGLIYVDNSNVWIEGMHVSAVEKRMAVDIVDAQNNHICDRSWSYDFGKLLYFAGGKKEDIKKAVLFGSRPPRNDSLWKIAKRVGFEVVVYDRNIKNKEKKIDTDITATIMEDSYELLDQAKDEIVLIAGDKDYVPLIEKVRKRKIKFVVCFWEHASRELKEICDQFVSLDQFLKHLKHS